MAEMSEASWLKCQLMDVVVSTPIHLAGQPTARLNLYAVRDGKPGDRQLLVVAAIVKSLLVNIGDESSVIACCKEVAKLTEVESEATRAVLYGKHGITLTDPSVEYSASGQAMLFHSTIKTLSDVVDDRNDLLFAKTRGEVYLTHELGMRGHEHDELDEVLRASFRKLNSATKMLTEIAEMGGPVEGDLVRFGVSNFEQAQPGNSQNHLRREMTEAEIERRVPDDSDVA